MPKLRPNKVKIYNPATGTKQSVEAFAMPTLLPEVNQILEVASGSPTVVQSTQTKWTVESARTWQLGTQLTLASLVTSVGIPTYEVFEGVMGVIGTDVTKLFNNTLRETGKTLSETIQSLGRAGEGATARAVEGSLEVGVGHALDNVAVIPVVGWIVDILVGLTKLIKKVVHIHRENQKPAAEAIYSPSAFTAEGDTIVFEQQYLERLGRFQDWTLVYLPPTLGKPASHIKEIDEQFLKPCGEIDTRVKWQNCDGIRFIGTNPIEGAIGNVPGTGWLHQSVEYYKNDRKIEPGAFLPSTRSQAGWLWETVIKGTTPATFTIDTQLLQISWEGYLYGLKVALYESRHLNDTDRERIVRFWNGGRDADGNYARNFGWINTGDVPHLEPVHNEWDEYQPVLEAKALRRKQRKMLDTLMVAYLDNSFPAVNNSKDPEFHDLWERRRRQLLEHPARCLVDIDNVPDGDYKRALIESGVTQMICAQMPFQHMVANEYSVPPPEITPQIGQFTFPGDGDDTWPRKPSMGVLPWVAAAAALGGLAWKKGLL